MLIFPSSRCLFRTLSVFLLLIGSGFNAFAVNPDPDLPPVEECKEEEEGECGEEGDPCARTTGSDYSYVKSFHWKLNTGKTLYRTTTTLIEVARLPPAASPMPTSRSMRGRSESVSLTMEYGTLMEKTVRTFFRPSGAFSVFLKIDKPLIDASLYTPQALSPLAVSNARVLYKTEAGYTHIGQILTDDALTDISVISSSSWRVRIWNRDSVNSTPVGGLYQIPDATVLPLNDLTFSNPDGDDSLGRLQMTRTVLVGNIPTTSTTLYTTSGGSLTSKEYEGTTIDEANLLRQTVTTRSGAGPKAWDYTLVREDSSISSELGVSGPLQVIRRTKEVYEDFSIGTAGGEAGFERLVQQIEGFASDAPLTTTRTYYSDPTNPFVHGRLKSLVRPDGYWEFYT